MVMLKSSALRLTTLLFLSSCWLSAQEDSVDDGNVRVPAPEIPMSGDLTNDLSIPKELKINNGGGTVSGSPDKGINFGGPVKVTGDNGLEIFASTARLDLKAKTITLLGDVSIYQGNVVQRGSRAVYHYDTKRLVNDDLRASVDPILLEAGKFTAVREGDRQVLIGENAGITTHDVEDPNFWIRANRTRIYPGEKIVFENMKVYAGDVPVFWFPYLSQPLDSELGYHFYPGLQTGWGPYLLNTYGVMLGGEKDPNTGVRHNEWLLSQWHFDIRADRGLGTGLTLADKHGFRNNSFPGFRMYYMNDSDPSFPRSGVPRSFNDPDRYSIRLQQRFNLDLANDPDADWRIDTNLNYLSDRFYMEDLEQDLVRTNPEPDNTVGIYRRTDNSLLSMFARLQLNDFYRADTRLPEVALDLPRAPLFDSPFLREGSYSFSVIGEQAGNITQRNVLTSLRSLNTGDSGAEGLLNQLTGYERELAEEMISLPIGDPRRDKIQQQLEDSGYTRFRAYEQISLPMMLGNFVSFTPIAGAGYTRYTQLDGPQDGFDRAHFHVGTEASMKFSKDYGNIRNHGLGLDGLLHVFQPYANWSVVSTNDYSPGDPNVDRLTPTTRPRTIDPARFTAVDQMDSWNILRLGGRNRLLTRRNNGTHEWLLLETYIDSFFDNPESDREFSNLNNDIRWSPVPWMSANLETQFPIANGGLGYNEINSGARFMPHEDFQFGIGYRYLDGHPILLDSSRIHLDSYTQLNENWGVGTQHWMELADGTLEYQQYTVHRDLGNWTAAMGLTMRDNRLKDEYGLIFMLTLKDLPSDSLPFEFGGQ